MLEKLFHLAVIIAMQDPKEPKDDSDEKDKDEDYDPDKISENEDSKRRDK